ncbi:hypothetical protein M231_06138 [Tremella mesenterica]|uniref:Uncharacterized protein n=1 Tax=Tremella mesenterica TaxID=5217 RepID=A0A4Q1BE26_TREME|nr:hypothetical protein M231_06138 [Tremella mesenterica]
MGRKTGTVITSNDAHATHATPTVRSPSTPSTTTVRGDTSVAPNSSPEAYRSGVISPSSDAARDIAASQRAQKELLSPSSPNLPRAQSAVSGTARNTSAQDQTSSNAAVQSTAEDTSAVDTSAVVTSPDPEGSGEEGGTAADRSTNDSTV